MFVEKSLALCIWEFTSYSVENTNKGQIISDSFSFNVQMFEAIWSLPSLIFSEMGSLSDFLEHCYF